VTRWATLQGHAGPALPDDQGDEPGLPADPPAVIHCATTTASVTPSAVALVILLGALASPSGHEDMGRCQRLSANCGVPQRRLTGQGHEEPCVAVLLLRGALDRAVLDLQPCVTMRTERNDRLGVLCGRAASAAGAPWVRRSSSSSRRPRPHDQWTARLLHRGVLDRHIRDPVGDEVPRRTRENWPARRRCRHGFKPLLVSASKNRSCQSQGCSRRRRCISPRRGPRGESIA